MSVLKMCLKGYLLDCHKTGTSIDEAMPFNTEKLDSVGRLENEQDQDKRNMTDDEEMNIVAWICARFLPCLVPAKMIPQLEDGKLFEVVTFDDVAFLLLLFEDSYNVWPKMAKAELERGEVLREQQQGSKPSEPQQPPAKKICRGTYKGEKKFKQGNGLSGKVAQSRFKILRRRIWRYSDCDGMVGPMEAAYNKKVGEFRMWEEQNNLRKKDGTSTNGGDPEGDSAVASSAHDLFVDEVSRQMLEAYADVLRVTTI
jgi:hypothetical protein